MQSDHNPVEPVQFSDNFLTKIDADAICFIDVDDTLLFGVGNYHDKLIDTLLNVGIKEVVLFTNMSLGCETIKERMALINYMQNKGLKVVGVITPCDLVWQMMHNKSKDELKATLELLDSISVDDTVAINKALGFSYEPGNLNAGSAFKESCERMNNIKENEIADFNLKANWYLNINNNATYHGRNGLLKDNTVDIKSLMAHALFISKNTELYNKKLYFIDDRIHILSEIKAIHRALKEAGVIECELATVHIARDHTFDYGMLLGMPYYVDLLRKGDINGFLQCEKYLKFQCYPAIQNDGDFNHYIHGIFLQVIAKTDIGMKDFLKLRQYIHSLEQAAVVCPQYQQVQKIFTYLYQAYYVFSIKDKANAVREADNNLKSIQGIFERNIAFSHSFETLQLQSAAVAWSVIKEQLARSYGVVLFYNGDSFTECNEQYAIFMKCYQSKPHEALYILYSFLHNGWSKTAQSAIAEAMGYDSVQQVIEDLAKNPVVAKRIAGLTLGTRTLTDN